MIVFAYCFINHALTNAVVDDSTNLSTGENFRKVADIQSKLKWCFVSEKCSSGSRPYQKWVVDFLLLLLLLLILNTNHFYVFETEL